MPEPHNQTHVRRSAKLAVADGPPADQPAVSEPVGEKRTTTLRLPVITVSVTRDQRNTAVERNTAVDDAAGQPQSGWGPRAGKVAFYGGIAALGVLEVIEWPLVLGLGVGTYVLRRIDRARSTEPGTDSGPAVSGADQDAAGIGSEG